MKCPSCKADMEREDCNEIHPSDLKSYLRTGKPTKSIVVAMYRCEGCDSEWIWRRLDGKIRMIDGAQFTTLENEARL